jgi:hypothetical protein
MECRYLEICPLFARIRLEESRRHYVDEFCHGVRFEECVRFKIKVRGVDPPLDLLPDGGVIAD